MNCEILTGKREKYGLMKVNKGKNIWIKNVIRIDLRFLNALQFIILIRSRV